ncbi:hypothetical protein SAMN05661096_02406 [Marivirga sericea]|uniref:Uncharacterized protein n=1 Tax=Marivirga sericea TaxID=1028 RepID=A0A1X7K510_9BACT|nr:hypothetical protein [Marivirga sericea]SMG36105.1 hypothetical protein SAMN05661096_02406 [Marivirga sericea]
MDKKTRYLLILIGFLSVATGIYGAFKTGEIIDSFSGVIIGLSIVVIALIERNKKS